MSFNTSYILNRRNSERVAIIDKNEAREQKTYSSPNFDFSRFSKFTVFVQNTLDVEIEVRLSAFDLDNNGKVIKVYDGEEFINQGTDTGTVSIPPNRWGDLFILNSALPWLDASVLDIVTFRITTTTIPTEGSFSIFVVGLPN